MDALRAAVDALPVFVMLVDAHHRILFANRAAAQELGVQPEALRGQHCPQAVHGCDGPVPGCPLEEAVTRGEAVVREVFDPARKRWVHSAVYPTGVRTQGGVPVFLHTVLDATAEVEARRRLAHRYEVERTLREIVEVSLLPISLSEQLRLVLDALLTLPGIRVERKGAIFLAQGDRLVLTAHQDLPEELCQACREVPLGKCLCGRAAATGEVQFASDLDARHEIRYPGIVPHGHYCLPIKHGGTVVGVLNLYVHAGYAHDPEEAALLEMLAAVVSKVIAHGKAEAEVAQGHRRIQEILVQTVTALASAVEQRDPYTAGHQRRVAELACAIARELGLPADRIQGLRLAALVHDVGKLAVPAEILSKPGRLGALEFELVKGHPERGWELLKDVDFPWPVAEIVREHHERLDGSGYPQGLKGEGILLEARILAVADVVEAMASHRPYREALGLEKALAEIETGKGRLYDPRVVDGCLRLFRDRGFSWPA